MDLTQGPISRTLLLFSLPVLGSSVLQSLNGSINAIWVGPPARRGSADGDHQRHPHPLAAAGRRCSASAWPPPSWWAKRSGAKDLPRAKQVVGTGAAFFLATSLAMAIGGFAASEQVLRWMDTPAEARAMAEAYLRVVFLSMPFMCFFAFMVMVQRGAGDARTPFWFMTLATILDIALNPLLITGFGPFPRMGIAGSAHIDAAVASDRHERRCLRISTGAKPICGSRAANCII